MKNNFPGEIIVAEINNLAASLFSMHGQSVSIGFKFYAANCELARRCWNAAVVVYFNAVVSDSKCFPISLLDGDTTSQGFSAFLEKTTNSCFLNQ